jgi:hypothetical protein
MNKLIKYCSILFLTSHLIGCVPTIDPVNTSNGADWMKFDKIFKSERAIRNIFASPFELLLISDNQFFRYDTNLELIEKRALKVDLGVEDVAPAITDNLYARLTKNNGDQLLEFTSTKNSASTVAYSNKQIADSTEAMNFEIKSTTNGCFSEDGTKYMIAGQISKPTNKVVFYIFDVKLNQSADAIVSIKKVKTIVAPNVNIDLSGVISSFKFFDSYFYVGTKQGGFKVAKDGSTITKLTPSWILNFFKFKNKIYANGFGGTNSLESDDSGLTWVRIQKNTPLKYVTVTNNYIFNQDDQRGLYKSGTQDLYSINEIVYPIGLNTNGFVCGGVQFFQGNYYMNFDKEIFFIKNIVTK